MGWKRFGSAREAITEEVVDVFRPFNKEPDGGFVLENRTIVFLLSH